MVTRPEQPSGEHHARTSTQARQALPLLDLVGYQPGVVGTSGGLAAIYCLLPLVFKTTAAVLAWRWRKVLEVGS